MKSSNWMSAAGLQSGERAAQLQSRLLSERSPAEVFVDHALLPFLFILVLGSLLGMFFATDAVSPWVEAWIGTGGEPHSMGALFNVYLKRVAGSMVGLLVTGAVVGALASAVLMWLRRHRPALFVRRGAPAAASRTSHG